MILILRWVHGYQVLSNLVSNAIKFTELGSICISWQRTENCNAPASCYEDVAVTEIPKSENRGVRIISYSYQQVRGLYF